MSAAMNETIVLVDISSSMDTPVSGDQRRIDVLSTILKNLLLPGMHLIAFNDRVTALEPGQRLPEPSGGTLCTWHSTTCYGCRRGV
jgi:hypothetical protein